ncbi:MAG: hypothetical protein AAGK05_19785, partial [Pseudomonadota bacterium]
MLAGLDLSIHLSPAVTFLFKLSVETCHVPSSFKKADITPIPKVNRPSQPSDFRPISIVSVLSKVFEKLILKKWVLPCICEKVNSDQFAYIRRPGSGTTSALVLAWHKV